MVINNSRKKIEKNIFDLFIYSGSVVLVVLKVESMSWNGSQIIIRAEEDGHTFSFSFSVSV